MNNSLNQNSKLLEEVLAGFNSDAVKTTLRGLRTFKCSPLLQVLEKPLAIPLPLCNMQYRVLRMSQ